MRLPPPGATPIVQAALGGWHCLALDEDGAAWAWGGNEYGQCGTDPETTGRDVASPSPCLPELAFAQVSAGGTHSVGVATTGDVWAWGERWGDFSVRVDRAPRPLPLPSPVAKVACGAFHTLALLDGGGVVAWGINDFGQLGSGDTTPTPTPAPVQGLPPAADVEAGGWHSLALTPDGAVYVWGRGEYGRLGLGDRAGASRLRATRVASLDGVRIVQASAGGTHTAALAEDGSLYTWGRGSFGRLGSGDERERCAPARVPLPGGGDRWRVVAVTCGGRHTVALAVPVSGGLGGGEGGIDLRRRSSVGGAPRPPPPPPPRWSEGGSTLTTAAAPPVGDPATPASVGASLPRPPPGADADAPTPARAPTPPIALPRGGRGGSTRSLAGMSERSSLAGDGDAPGVDATRRPTDEDDDDDDTGGGNSLRSGAAAGLTSALARAALDSQELADATAPRTAGQSPPSSVGGSLSPVERGGGHQRRGAAGVPSPLGRASNEGEG